MQDETEKTKPSRGIYLLPNLITTIALFCGFSSIIAALHHQFANAALGVYVAMIADLLDGRVARLTGTESDFGAEYDSLSDMVSFGIAPALLIYTWSLDNLGHYGWLIAFVYAAAGALRLARFNTQDDHTTDFQGLSIPAAAGLLVGLVWVFHNKGNLLAHDILGAVITVLAALLMVSSVPYSSFKQFNFRRKAPFIAIVLVILLFVVISLDPPGVIFGGFALYALSGPAMFLVNKFRKKKANIPAD